MEDPFTYVEKAVFFGREIRRADDPTITELIEMSAPILKRDGIYLCFVRSRLNPEREVAVMPGDDAVSALMNGLSFMRDLLDHSGHSWTFEGRLNGGIPLRLASFLSQDRVDRIERHIAVETAAQIDDIVNGRV